jgi:PIN domain nuclease of toxin-antitoxin system
MNVFMLGACALIAFLRDESGAEAVASILECANEGKAEIRINSINFLEVYYDMYRNLGRAKADEALEMIKKLPIVI